MTFFSLKLLFALGISLLITLYVTPLLAHVARRLGIMDIPDGKAKNHKEPTPYLGGIAVYTGFIIAVALTFPVQNNFFLFLTGSTLLLFIGLIDDLVVLAPGQKMFGQLVATFCFLKAGLYLKETFFYNYWNIPLSALWILLVINAFNLIDIMDGLATIVASCAAFSFLLCALYAHNHDVALLLSSLLGALIGFFYYNKPLAQIYLGDTGSLFIGGFMATIPFWFDWGTYTPWGYITPLIILAIPLLEIGALIVIRTYKGIPFYKPSPDHFAIYLRRNGWSVSQILIYCFFLSIFLGTSALLFLTSMISIGVLFCLGMLFLGIWVGMLYCTKQYK